MFVVFLVVVCDVVVVFRVVVCGVVVVVVVVIDDEGVTVVVLVVVLLVVIRGVVDAVFAVSDDGEPYLQTGCDLIYLFQTFGTYSRFPFACVKRTLEMWALMKLFIFPDKTSVFFNTFKINGFRFKIDKWL